MIQDADARYNATAGLTPDQQKEFDTRMAEPTKIYKESVATANSNLEQVKASTPLNKYYAYTDTKNHIPESDVYAALQKTTGDSAEWVFGGGDDIKGDEVTDVRSEIDLLFDQYGKVVDKDKNVTSIPGFDQAKGLMLKRAVDATYNNPDWFGSGPGDVSLDKKELKKNLEKEIGDFLTSQQAYIKVQEAEKAHRDEVAKAEAAKAAAEYEAKTPITERNLKRLLRTSQ